MVTQKELKREQVNSSGNFFKEFKGEFKRITYPSKEQVKKSLSTVIVFCLAYILFIAAIDGILDKVFNLILK